MALIYPGWCELALDGGPAVRDERVALGDDPALAAALSVAVFAHAGIHSEIVMRPLVGVALTLPHSADHAQCAQAIDAECVTASFLDFAGRACVAVPADIAHVAQAAHSVAKVTHVLYELHTPFIDSQEAGCVVPTYSVTDTAPYELAIDLLEQAAVLVRALDGVPATQRVALHPLLSDGITEVRRALMMMEPQ